MSWVTRRRHSTMWILLLRVLVLHVLTVIMDVVWNCTFKATTLRRNVDAAQNCLKADMLFAVLYDALRVLHSEAECCHYQQTRPLRSNECLYCRRESGNIQKSRDCREC